MNTEQVFEYFSSLSAHAPVMIIVTALFIVIRRKFLIVDTDQ